MGKNKKAEFFLDSALGSSIGAVVYSGKSTKNNQICAKPTLFSRGKRTDCFLTDDSGLYILRSGKKGTRSNSKATNSQKYFDGLGSRFANNYMKYRPNKKKSSLIEFYAKKADWIKLNMDKASLEDFNFWKNLSFARAWNFSLIGAVIVGMVSMSFIYRYLGSGASAESKSRSAEIKREAIFSLEKPYPQSRVLGEENAKEKDKNGIYFESVLSDLIESQKNEFEEKIRTMVTGYPIEEMAPYIAEQDPVVAAFLISIARKESSWGTRVPVLNGQDCYNYWGYRGIRKLMGTGGHTCFNSREDAVETVAKRIAFLVSSKKLDTPAKMVIWKCGSDCDATGGQAAAKKWINDVDHYFKKFNEI